MASQPAASAWPTVGLSPTKSCFANVEVSSNPLTFRQHLTNTVSIKKLRHQAGADPMKFSTIGRLRCAMYVTLFLDNGGVEDYFNTREYQELDCAEFPPWSLAERTR